MKKSFLWFEYLIFFIISLSMAKSVFCQTPTPTACPIVTDSFNRPDNSSSLGTADTGQSWLAYNQNFGISSGQAYAPTQYGRALINSGGPDYTVQCVLSNHETNQGVIFRAQDQNNFYVVWDDTSGGHNYKWGYFANNTLGVLGSGGPAPANGDIIKVVCKWCTCNIYVDDALLTTITDNTFTNTGTQCGMLSGDSQIGSMNIAARWSNFMIGVTSGVCSPSFTPTPNFIATPIIMAELVQSQPSQNYGCPSYYFVGNNYNSTNSTAVLKWNLSAIQPGSTINWAFLSMYVANAGGMTTCYVSRIAPANNLYTQYGACWNYQTGTTQWVGGGGGCMDLGWDCFYPYMGIINPLSFSYTQFTVPLSNSEVLNMLSSNEGMCLLPGYNLTALYFGGFSNNCPQLQICYNPPTSTPTNMPTPIPSTLIQESNVHTVPDPIKGNTGVIQYYLAGQAQSASIEIFTSNGRSIWTKPAPTNAGTNQFFFGVSGLANGAYLYRIRVKDLSGKETTVIKKLAIVR